ncbi:MAG: HlyD family efflux transporter periplasmic adaptor subunit [Fimbriimonadaceae bacterium]
MTKRTAPLIAIALLVSGCNMAGSLNPAGAPVKVTSDAVKRQDLTGYNFFDGKLVIPDSAQGTAFSPYDTPIVSVSAGLGKKVDRGQQIVKLEIPGAEAAATMAKQDVKTAQANLDMQRSDNSASVIEAKGLLAEAQLAEKDAKDTFANGGDADVAWFTQNRIEAEVVLAQAQQDLKVALQMPRSAVIAASGNLAEARADAAKGIVRAPISGTVVSLQAKPGMAAVSNQQLVSIVNFDKVRVQAIVPAEFKDLVTKGTRVIVAMRGANSNPLDGIVLDVGIAPPVEGQTSPGYLAVIQFTDLSQMIQPSVLVKRVGVKAGTVKNAIVVPVGALFTRSGKRMVSVKNGEKWVQTQVETGISDGALTEIKSGLSEGAVVRVTTSK